LHFVLESALSKKLSLQIKHSSAFCRKSPADKGPDSVLDKGLRADF
jgi:hypothetical protein